MRSHPDSRQAHARRDHPVALTHLDLPSSTMKNSRADWPSLVKACPAGRPIRVIRLEMRRSCFLESPRNSGTAASWLSIDA
jgi:hypothetical protein